MRPEVRARGGRGTFVVSLVAHAALLTVVVIAPLVATDTLPSPHESIGIFVSEAALPPAPPPPPGNEQAPDRAAGASPQDAVPVSYEAADGIGEPADRGPVVDLTLAMGPVGSGVPTGITGGLDMGVPAPPSPPPPSQPSIVRVGHGVRMPSKLVDVPPAYPRLARDVRREGTVVIEAVIGTDGVVRDARVLKSVALLDAAALDAVRQWRYQPTLLNGVPVPVIVTVTVVFRLH
jgi:protein TonB